MRVAILDDAGFGSGQSGLFGKELYVDVLARINEEILGNQVTKIVLGEGVESDDCGVAGTDLPFVRPFYDPNLARKLTDVLKKRRIQLLHANLLNARYPRHVANVAGKLSIPLVSTVHSWGFVCPTGWGVEIPSLRPCGNGLSGHCLRSLWCLAPMEGKNRVRRVFDGVNQYLALRGLLRASCAVISPSRSLAQRIREVHGFSNVHWSLNPIPESLLLRKPIYGGEGAVAFVGRLAYEKGAHLLPKIASLLPRVHLHVMGSGPLEGYLRQNSEKYPNLIFHGFVTTEEKSAIINRTAAIIMPILYTDTLPYTVIEAFVFGKPVVGFALGGVKEMVEDSGAGFAIPPYDMRNFAEKIDSIVDNPRLSIEMGRKGRKFVEENLAPRKYALTLGNIYSKFAG